MDPLPEPVTYVCGDCGYENTLKVGDVIQCRECGSRKIEDRYGVPLDESAKLRQQVLSLISQCADRAQGNKEILQRMVNQMQKLKDEIWQQIPNEHSGIRNKGSGFRKRNTGPAEDAKEKNKKPKRYCKKRGEYVRGHDWRNHDKVMQKLDRNKNEREQTITAMDNTSSRGKQPKGCDEEDDTTYSEEIHEYDSSSN